MKTLVELKTQRRVLLERSKALLLLAQEEGRDFTADEGKEMDATLKEAEQLDVQIKVMQGDQALRDAVLAITGDGDPRSGWGKGAWTQAFFKGLNTHYAGRKEFLPTTGTVGVPNPITSIATLSNVGRAETILQFIPTQPPGQTDSVSYLREVERTHNAAPVAVSQKKPTSVYTLERVDDRIKTIAHLSEPVSRNWLSDAPLLSQYLDGVLREGLMLEVENQILNGNGLGENFLGITYTPLVQVQPFVVDPIITCRHAITLLENLPCVPTGFAMHPNDWETIELLPDLVGRFMLENGGQGLPVDRARRRLWGLPVALSVRATEGIAILGDWTAGSKMWPREDARVDWSECFQSPGFEYYDVIPASGFERNLVMFRAELRSLFAVLIARRFVIVDLLEVGT